MIKKAIALLLLLAPCAVDAQTEVTAYRPGVTDEGITYFLPKTALHFTVTATRTLYTPGEYAAYAERYLRLKDVTQTPYEVWQITSIDMTPYGVADTGQAYSIKLKAKTAAPLVSLAADGRLLAINVDQVDDEKTLSRRSVVRDAAKTLRPADYQTEEILSAGSVSKMAELTAGEIYDIRENRSLLTKGQADFMPKDGEQLRLMLAQLDVQEEALLQLFKGTATQETHTFVIDEIPAGAVDKKILFRFSKHFGLVEADDYSGEPYTLTVRDLHSLTAEESAPRPRSPRSRSTTCATSSPGVPPSLLASPTEEVLQHHASPWPSWAAWNTSAATSSTRNSPPTSTFPRRPAPSPASWENSSSLTAAFPFPHGRTPTQRLRKVTPPDIGTSPCGVFV